MIKVALVRGKYLNNYEGQSYVFSAGIDLTGIASSSPMNKIYPFPVINFPSLADLPLPFIKYVANRTLGDMHNLWGLEGIANKFDIFHTADPYYYYSYQLAKLRHSGKISALVSTVWETIPFNNEKTYAKKQIKNFTQNAVDRFLTYTKKAKESLILEGISEKKIYQVSLGVDLSRFFPSQSSRKSDSINVLFVGRDVPEKGLGDLRQVISTFSGKKVRLLTALGGVNYDYMPEIYREADIFVLPSKKNSTWEEQYGMVAIEALASGLPIIAYDTGAIAEVIGRAGIVIPPDLQALKEALGTLINDSRLRRKYSLLARDIAEKKYNAASTASHIGRMYYELNENNGNRSHKKRRNKS